MKPALHPDFLSKPISHRGLHDVESGRPENSREAINHSISYGYAIEIDLQLSADHVPMVFHDYELDRLTSQSGPVRTRHAQELFEINLNGGNEGIPSLENILHLVAGRAPLLIEFKDQDGAMGENVGLLEKQAAQLLREYHGAVAVMSFNPHSVAKLADLLPDVPRGLITCAYRPEDWPLSTETCDRLREIPDFERTKSTFISHEVDDLDRGRVAELKSRGANVLCWTVKSIEQEKQARQIAQNITFEQYLAAFPPRN